MPDRDFANCLARVAARGSMGQKEAQQILDEVYERAEKMRQTGEIDPYVHAAADITNGLKERAAADLVDSLRNAAKRAAIIEPIKAKGIASAADRIRSLFFWTSGAKDQRNIQTLNATLTHQWTSVLWSELNRQGLTKLARAPEALRDIARELWGINAGEVGAKTTNKEARAIAEAFKPLSEDIRTRLNSEGARIGSATDYAASTSHDPYLMRQGGRGQQNIKNADAAFEAWWAHTRPRLAEKTFDDLHADVMPREGETQADAEKRFGRAVWEAQITGVRKPMPGEATDGPSFGASFQGSRNMARKISEGRVLFWKDADAWTDYIQRYGRPTNFYEMAIQHAQYSARSASMMHFLGTNPTANYATIVRRIQEHFRSDVDGVNKFQGQLKGGLTQPNMDAVLSILDGSANAPSNEMFATIGSTVRQFYDMEFLGSVGITHATSTVATVPTQGRHFGMGTFESLGNLLHSIVPESLKGPGRDELMKELGAYGNGATRKAFNSFGHGWNIPGQIAALHDKYMTATGIHYWLDHATNGFKEAVAYKLGKLSEGEYGAIEPHLRGVLGRYGIGPEEWDLLRQTKLLETPNGAKYLTPKAGLDTDQAAVESLLRQRGQIAAAAKPEDVAPQIEKFQRNLADSYAMMLEDAARGSVVTGGIRERAMWGGATRTGSIAGEAVRMAMMFKTWPLAALHQMIGREVYQSLGENWSGARLADAGKGVFSIIGLSMLGGYIRMTLGDMFAGRQYREPRNAGETAKIMAAALAQGGGLGIFGDYLFGEANRFGGSFGGTMGGPVAQDAEQLVGIYNRWIQALGNHDRLDRAEKDFWPDLARFGVQHVPMQNLFYLKATADYMLWYHAFEALHPGWWHRTNERMKKEQGRTLMGYQPGAPIPYAPPYLQGQMR